MCLATQEVFRKLKDFIKKKKSIGIPVIFIGHKYFKGKRPLMGTSVYFRLSPRTTKDIQQILKHILIVFIDKNKNNTQLINIQKNNKEQLELCKKSGGDVRKIIKYFELITEYNDVASENEISMQTFNNKGSTYSLDRIIKHEVDIHTIADEILSENMLPYGLNSSYINYIPWFIKKNNSTFQKKRCLKLWKNVAKLFSIYGNLKDYEKNNQMWELSEIANIIICWGMGVLIENNIKTDPDVRVSAQKDLLNAELDVINIKNGKTDKPIYKGKNFWWVDLEKGKKNGDEPIDTSLYNINLRGSLNEHIVSNTSFKMIESDIGHSMAWKPKNIRGTIQLLKLKKNITNITNIDIKDMYTKIPDRLIKMVGIDKKN